MKYISLPTLAARLNYAMQERGVVQEKLAEMAGCSQTAIQKLTAGKTARSRFLPAIARALVIDLDWLELGIDKGAPLGVRESPVTYGRRKDDLPDGLGALSPWDDNTPLDDDEVALPLYKEVELQSGNGRSHVSESTNAKLRFSLRTLRQCGVDPAAAACATNSGNSNHPLILHNATLGIDKGHTRVVDGEIYAIDHDGLLRVKFLYRLPGGGLRFRSFNDEEYPDENYSFDDIIEKQIRILGRVFWWSTLRPLGSPPLM
ncbi:MAG: helix-turn-helix transcriptional regulator [Gammaproteobacteria bacterium]|nr:helix-turn-helix transcriptional regulator [Gammaproteobacteria bacterium]MBU1803623.1 helix-turn-helix transcriptional regulator [Gammaproteobacteria bacterium]